MKSKNFFNELILWILVLIPIIFYFYFRAQLPEQIPIHFGAQGQADNWISKQNFLWFLLALNLGIYLLMLIIPIIDPKRKVSQSQQRYFALRLILNIFIAFLSISLMIIALNQKISSFIIPEAIAVFILVFGNYMPTIRPNYFIGIRTPWTLENNEIWVKTHRLGGWLWAFAGILLIISGFVFKNIFWTLFVIVIGLIVLVPVLYSFILYVKQKKSQTATG